MEGARSAGARSRSSPASGSFLDDTSALADLILPDHSFLESWVEAAPESGAAEAVATVAGPAMRPLYHDARHARRAARGRPAAEAAARPPLPSADASRRCCRRRHRVAARATGASPAGDVAPVDGAGRPVQRAAQFDGDAERVSVPFPALRVAGVLRRLARAPAVAAGAAGSDDHRDVEQLGRDQLRRPPSGWASPRATWWRSPRRTGSLRAPAVISPGIAPDVIAMPVGQGHETFTRYASGRGANPMRDSGAGRRAAKPARWPGRPRA